MLEECVESFVRNIRISIQDVIEKKKKHCRNGLFTYKYFVNIGKIFEVHEHYTKKSSFQNKIFHVDNINYKKKKVSSYKKTSHSCN